MGLKEELIRGLWLTQAGGKEGYGRQGEPAATEAGVTLHQPEVHRVFSCVLCLHTGFLVASAAALVSHAHLLGPC